MKQRILAVNESNSGGTIVEIKRKKVFQKTVDDNGLADNIGTEEASHNEITPAVAANVQNKEPDVAAHAPASQVNHADVANVTEDFTPKAAVAPVTQVKKTYDDKPKPQAAKPV